MTVIDTKEIHCFICGSSSLQPIRKYRTKTQHGKAIFDHSWLYTCQGCGLVQVMPMPSAQQMADYYFRDYRLGCKAGADVADLTLFPKDNLFYYNRGQSIAELISPYISIPNPTILDIGAGYGHILSALRQRFPGSHQMAIEFSQVCVDHLRSLGINVFSQSAEEILPNINQKLDMVIISHVLEHLLNPGEVLRLIHERLSSNGILYIEVPNIPVESLLRYVDSTWAPRFDEPHTSFFSLNTLRSLLQSIGYEVDFSDTSGPPYHYVSKLNFHLPHWRWFFQDVIPKPVFDFLRRQRATASLRVSDREDEFYKYGGFRIWLRSVSRLSR